VPHDGNQFERKRGTKESEAAENRGWLTEFMYEEGRTFETRDSQRGGEG